jgi:multicomponent Na+:H+ antiporter subunit G
MIIVDALRIVLLTAGLFFFASGALGLLRFPDTYTRLHAATKADNVGLGLLAAGLSLSTADWQNILVILLIWLLVMASGATSAQLLARYQREQDQKESSSHGDR